MPHSNQNKRGKNIKGNLPNSLTTYDKGNKHENGGIPIPEKNAEVEQGETKMGSYIFSDSPDMKLTKTLAKKHGIPEKHAGKKFSEVSKKIEKQYNDRENDLYTDNAKTREFDALEKAQEEKREEKAAEALKKFMSYADPEDIQKLQGGSPQPQQRQPQSPQPRPQRKAPQPKQSQMQPGGPPPSMFQGGGNIDPGQVTMSVQEAKQHIDRMDQLENMTDEDLSYFSNYLEDAGDQGRSSKLRDELARRYSNRHRQIQFENGGDIDPGEVSMSIETARDHIDRMDQLEQMNQSDVDYFTNYFESTGDESDLERSRRLKDEIARRYQNRHRNIQFKEGGEMNRREMNRREMQAQQGLEAAGTTAATAAFGPLGGAAVKGGQAISGMVNPDKGDLTFDGNEDTGEAIGKGVAMATNPLGTIAQYGSEVMKYGGDMKKYENGGEELPTFDTMGDQPIGDQMSQDAASVEQSPYQGVTEDTNPPVDMSYDSVMNQDLSQENQVNPYDSGLSTMQKVAPFIKPAVGLATMAGGPEDVDYREVDPDKVDYEEARDVARRQAALSRARAEENIRKNANTAGQALQGNIAANISSQRNLNNALMQNRMKERNKNVGIMNRADRTNAQISRQEDIAEAKNRARFDQNLTGVASDVGRGVSGLERDKRRYQSQNQYQANYMDAINRRASNYRLKPVRDDNGNIIRYEREFVPSGNQ